MYTETDFLNFLIESKKSTYAAQDDDASVNPLLAGSRQLEYRRGEFFYRDIYFGMNFFIGQETVYFQDVPIWSMAYSGGVENPELAGQVYSFLRKALLHVSAQSPYRGPEKFADREFVYTDLNNGTIGQFTGKETIFLNSEEVYSLNYSGGFIR